MVCSLKSICYPSDAPATFDAGEEPYRFMLHRVHMLQTRVHAATTSTVEPSL